MGVGHRLEFDVAYGPAVLMGKLIDRVGHRYGHLLPIRFEKRGRYGGWICRCDGPEKYCVKEKWVRTECFVPPHGRTTSCGCVLKQRCADMAKIGGAAVPFRDIAGNRFGRLVVLSRLPTGSGSRWLCQCDCGNETRVQLSNLHSGKQVSCGCFKLEQIKSVIPESNRARGQYAQAEKSAREEELAIQECLSTIQSLIGALINYIPPPVQIERAPPAWMTAA